MRSPDDPATLEGCDASIGTPGTLDQRTKARQSCTPAVHCRTISGMTSTTREPQLEGLMTFLAAARLGRYTAAAEVLGVNHSTVSRRIASLEEAMGGRVLVRTPAGWETTALGRRALAVAERIEASVRQLADEGTEGVAAIH